MIKVGFESVVDCITFIYRIQGSIPLLKYASCGSLNFLGIFKINHIMSQPDINVKKDKLKVIEWLTEHFPAAFFSKAKQIKPLKIGLFDDLIDFYERLESPPFSKKLLRDALNYYSGSPSYLSSQKANVPRVDLYGNEVDVVTEGQAKYAHQRFQDRYVKTPKQNKVDVSTG